MIEIYKITNKINGKMYIGASTRLNERKTEHFKPYRINSLKDKIPLYEAMDKYGREIFSFEVIERTTADKLDEREEHYIKEFNAVEKGYNVVETAHNMHDEDYTKEVHGSFFSEWNKKQWEDEDYRNRMSEQSSQVQKDRLKDPEYLAEKSAQLRKYTDSIKKTVGQYDKEGNLIAEYEGVREAERTLGLANDSVGKICRGVKGRKTAGGYVWKYL